MKVERLVAIVMLLLERKTMNAAELARIFEVSPRTIYRDIEAINRAGIPVFSQMGPNGGVSIMEQYKVDKRLFSASDIAALLIGLGGVRTALTGDDFTHTLAKIQSMIPKEQLAQIEAQLRQVSIDLTPWSDDPKQEGHLVALRESIANQRTVKLEYTDVRGDATQRSVEPYRLLLKAGRWYLQGYCLLRGELRTFHLRRIAWIEQADSPFTPRVDLDALDARLPTVVSPTVDVTVRFPESHRHGIAALWGDDLTIVASDGEQCTATLRLIDEEARYNMLLLVDRCECLAPPKVRNYLVRRIEELAVLYGAKEKM